MPHEGQRNPVISLNEQGGKPNCWCVPNPRVSGCKVAAVTSNVINVLPPSTIKIRWYERKRMDVRCSV